MSRKRRRQKAGRPVPASPQTTKRHPLHEAFIACREVAEGLYSLFEDCWKNDLRHPKPVAGILQLLWALITVPWQDHSIPTTASSSASSLPESRKRPRRK